MQRNFRAKPDFKRHLLPTLLSVGVLALAFATAAHAQSGGNYGLGTAAGTTIPTSSDLAALIGKLLRVALGFVGTLFLILMIYGGFTYMTARGDSKKIDTAKQMITGAIIGVVIIASAYGVTSFVLNAVSGGGGGSSGATTHAPGSVTLGGDCSDPADCASGLQCTTGASHPKPACLGAKGASCSKGADCLGQLLCTGGKCT